MSNSNTNKTGIANDEAQRHEPSRQVQFLRQALSQDKKPLGLFLGAGCALAIRVSSSPSGTASIPLIPDVAGMTLSVSDQLRADGGTKKAFSRLCQHFDGHEQNPTIEHYLSQIRTLKMVAGAEAVRGLTIDDLESLEIAICNEVYKLVNKSLPSRTSPFHHLASWIGAVWRDHPVEVFTTNYDLLTEQALEERRVPFFDGFVGSRGPFFDANAIEDDRLPPRWARLWKLHGSINWRLESGHVSRTEPSVIKPDERRLIHPSHLKYDESRKMPYLAMLDRLRAFLRQPSVLLVTCGYSFADEHLNDVLRQGLEANPTAHVFGLIYGDIAGYKSATTVASQRSNLSLLAEDCAIIGTRLAPYMQRAKEEIEPDPTGAIRWEKTHLASATVPGRTLGSSADKNGLNTKLSARVCVGDFAVFGCFLADLLGEAAIA